MLESACLELSSEPTLRLERSIYRAIGFARRNCRRESRRRHSGSAGELRRIVETGDILIRYQPIVDLDQGGAAHGYEALSSAPTPEIFENPEVLFSFAEESEGIVDLERLCRRQALERIAPVFGRKRHSQDFHQLLGPRLRRRKADRRPAALAAPKPSWPTRARWCSRSPKGPPSRNGKPSARSSTKSGPAASRSRSTTWAPVIRALRAVGEIQPDYLKFDRTLSHGIHTSAIKRNLLETLVSLAGKIGARSIAEGIEAEEELEVVKALGVEPGPGLPLRQAGLARNPRGDPLSGRGASERTTYWSWLGRQPYGKMFELQQELRRKIHKENGPEHLLLLEHDPVYTVGRNAKIGDVLADPEWLKERGIEVAETNRGGQVTYHGPGQLVGYPIIDLKPDRRDIGKYVWDLQEVLIRTLADFGIEGRRKDGKENHRRVGGGAEDRLDRSASRALDHHPRLCAERADPARRFPGHRRVRAARRHHDVDGAGIAILRPRASRNSGGRERAGRAICRGFRSRNGCRGLAAASRSSSPPCLANESSGASASKWKLNDEPPAHDFAAMEYRCCTNHDSSTDWNPNGFETFLHGVRHLFHLCIEEVPRLEILLAIAGPIEVEIDSFQGYRPNLSKA